MNSRSVIWFVSSINVTLPKTQRLFLVNQILPNRKVEAKLLYFYHLNLVYLFIFKANGKIYFLSAFIKHIDEANWHFEFYHCPVIGFLGGGWGTYCLNSRPSTC